MKIISNKTKSTCISLTTLNGFSDQHGNIETISKANDWSIVSNQHGVDHYMKTNRYNNLRAKHKFVNNTDNDITFKWIINVSGNDGQHIKYDFGMVCIKAGATKFTISVPYKCSSLMANSDVKRIMVAIMIF